MKNIAILCPIHRNIELVALQLDNYKKYTDNRCTQILHRSKEGFHNFTLDKISKYKSFDGVRFSRYAATTSWKTCMGAFIACSDLLDRSEFDYVYIHTDGDLLIYGDLFNYIVSNKIGYSGIYFLGHEVWPHFKLMANDTRLLNLIDSIGLKFSDLVFGRQEGAFFPTSLWLKIINKITEFYDDSYFDEVDLHWPLEEVLVPTLAKFYSEDADHVPNVVFTKQLLHSGGRDNPLNCISIEDIQAHRFSQNSHNCIALKWFATNSADLARLYLSSLDVGK
jgi:hypothetical protein